MCFFFPFPYPDPNPGDPRHQFPTSGRPYNCPGRWQNFWNGILPRASETKQDLCRIPPELCTGWRNWRGWTNKYSIVFSSNISFSVKSITDIFFCKVSPGSSWQPGICLSVLPWKLLSVARSVLLRNLFTNFFQNFVWFVLEESNSCLQNYFKLGNLFYN